MTDLDCEIRVDPLFGCEFTMMRVEYIRRFSCRPSGTEYVPRGLLLSRWCNAAGAMLLVQYRWCSTDGAMPMVQWLISLSGVVDI